MNLGPTIHPTADTNYSPHYSPTIHPTADTNVGRISVLRSWSEQRAWGSSSALLCSQRQALYYHAHCLSVVSICGIESESYYLQIAEHKHPNNISGTRALKISFLRVLALQGVMFQTLSSRSQGLVFQKPTHRLGWKPFQVILCRHFPELTFQRLVSTLNPQI